MGGKNQKSGKGEVKAVNPEVRKEKGELMEKTELNPILAVDLGAKAAELAESPDELEFQKMLEPKNSARRTRDENAAFTKFREFVHRMLGVAAKKQHYQLEVSKLIQGAVDLGIFSGIEEEYRYRRAYNYFLQQVKDLPTGWRKVERKKPLKNVLIFTPSTPAVPES